MIGKHGKPVSGWDFMWPTYKPTFHEAVRFADQSAHAEVWRAKTDGHFSEWRKVGSNPIAVCIDAEWIVNPEEKKMAALFNHGAYVGSDDEVLASLIGDSYDEEMAGASSASEDIFDDDKPARSKKAGKGKPAKSGKTAKVKAAAAKPDKAKANGKAKKVKVARGGTPRMAFDDKQMIHVKVERVGRAGTKSGDEWNLLRNKMTVGAYRAALAKKFGKGKKPPLPYYIRAGFVSVK